MDNEEVLQDDLNPAEEETSKNDEGGEEEKDWQKLYEAQKVRAEKAERKLKEPSREPAPKPEGEKTPNNEPTLSAKDSARLLQANVPVDDWDEVINYANFKGIPVAEALKSSVVKATLAERNEERNSALAANAGSVRKGAHKTDPSRLLDKARTKGEIPEKDEDLDAMLAERYKPNSN
jgi:hypothetical protein